MWNIRGAFRARIDENAIMFIMTIALSILAGLLLLIGFIGCVVPVLPGPIIGYCGLLALIPTEKCPSTPVLVTMGLVVAAVTVADYVVPAIGARKFDCSRWGMAGCFVGTMVGLFFVPVGILLGPFLGAFLGELIARKPVGAALKGGFGAFLGFLSGVFLKILACVAMTAVVVYHFWG